jgi:RNA polymerase sigma-70 factor, ECF subfamily
MTDGLLDGQCEERQERPRLSAEAFKRELEPLIPQVRAFARFLCQSDRSRADDLAQEALMRAWQARESFAPGTQMRAWLFVIVRNLFYSERRRAWRVVAYDETAAERTLQTKAVQNEQLELDDVRRALALVPDDQREALILVSAGGLSYEDAAGICGCAVGTIKSRVNRGRKALTLALESTIVPNRDTPAEMAIASLLNDARRVANER